MTASEHTYDYFQEFHISNALFAATSREIFQCSRQNGDAILPPIAPKYWTYIANFNQAICSNWIQVDTKTDLKDKSKFCGHPTKRILDEITTKH